MHEILKKSTGIQAPVTPGHAYGKISVPKPVQKGLNETQFPENGALFSSIEAAQAGSNRIKSGLVFTLLFMIQAHHNHSREDIHEPDPGDPGSPFTA